MPPDFPHRSFQVLHDTSVDDDFGSNIFKSPYREVKFRLRTPDSDLLSLSSTADSVFDRNLSPQRSNPYTENWSHEASTAADSVDSATASTNDGILFIIFSS